MIKINKYGKTTKPKGIKKNGGKTKLVKIPLIKKGMINFKLI